MSGIFVSSKLVRKVEAFKTGDEVPVGAVYLNSVKEEIVWHYFIVERQEEQTINVGQKTV